MINVQAEVCLKKGKEFSIQRFHPWVFSGAIHSKSSEPQQGDWVCVTDYKGKTLGYGHYQTGSISIRMLQFGDTPPTSDFWIDRMKMAWSQRLQLGILKEDTNAFRMIHAEGDGLPGLIIDYYNGAIVMQAHSVGMHISRHQIAGALQEILKNNLHTIYYKSKNTLPSSVEEDVKDEYLLGSKPDQYFVLEHGNKFYIDWETGQKTGFFLDQRENRYDLSRFTHGKSVLNTFCYSGGFSIYALRGGATTVHSVDASAKAIDLTKRNLELNGFDHEKHACYAIDTFEFLKDSNDKYDIIILDPPAFAKHRDARHQAVKGYQRLNTEAMKVIKPGGLIFTFSCSQVVDRQLFYDTMVSSAIQSGRQIKVLQHFGQPGDHPVSLFHPEGEYLKGLLLMVV